jgi:acetylornithine deacetylase
MHMGLVLAELETLRREWGRRWCHPELGTASLHVPVIGGGRHLFVYSEACRADVECRTVPGQTEEETVLELRRAVERAGSGQEHFAARVEPVLWRSPHAIDSDRPIVRAVRCAVERVLGSEPRTGWHGWWEDSGLLGEAGIDAVVIGPAGGGLHEETEWVDLESVVRLAEILLDTTHAYCGAERKEPGNDRPQA